MSATLRGGGASSDNRDSAEIEEKLNQRFKEYYEKSEAQNREKDILLQHKDDRISIIEAQYADEKEKRERIENKLKTIEENLSKEKQQRILNEDLNELNKRQIEELNEQVEKLQKEKEKEIQKRRDIEEMMKLSNEEKEKSLKLAQEAKQSSEIAQQRIIELEGSINSAKEQGRREVAPILVSTQEKLRVCQSELKQIQEEKVSKEEKLKHEMQQIGEELSKTKIELEISNIKCESIQNQYDTEKQQWVQKQQQEKKEQKDNNNDKEKSDRFEALFQQGEEQRRKLESELRKEQEERMKAVRIRKEIEEKFVLNEEERRKVKQQLRFEEDEKISALTQVEELEKNEQEERKRRIDAESENRSLKWENDKMKKEIDRLKYENEEEKNSRKEFQIKYDIEIDEQLREAETRKQIEIQLKKEKIDKQEAIQKAEEQERKTVELDQRLQNALNELQIKNDEYEKIKLKSEKDSTKAKEEENKRKQIEIENVRLEMENWNLNRDIEKMKIVSERLNSELGEDKMNEQMDLSENLQKEQDEQIKRLRDDLEREITEKRRHEDEIVSLRQQIKRLNDEFESERAEKQRNEQDLANLSEQIGQQPVAIKPILSVPDTQYCYISGDTFLRTSRPLEKDYTITVDPVVSEGIVYFEGIFYNHDREIFHIGVQNAEWGAQNKKKVKYYSDGDISHIGDKYIKGNSKFMCNQKVGIEVDLTSNPRKLTFFVNGNEQPTSFVDIPKAIRFFAYTYQRYSQFRVTRFQRRTTSQAKRVAKSLNWHRGIDYKDVTVLSLPLIGDEIQKKNIQQMQETICQYIDNIFYDKKDEQGRLQLIKAGVTANLLTIFETRQLNEITKHYIDAFFIFTYKSSDEIVQLLIKKKDPFPGLLRLLDHLNDQIVQSSILSIMNILIYRSNGTDQNQPHPCFQAVEQLGGVEKIIQLFRKNLNKKLKDNSAICIGRLFRAREITNPEMKQVIVYLKQLVNDPDAWTKGAAKYTIKDLAKNEVNRVFIESDGFKIPQ
ncbi:MAG: hypothetical protein EZS28_012300 [Streblomastix strix]|uniref:B30.2/SPRY domain-containing protein n=1 Tax=Streblomastix strix TaxID=222440 RepID=A0A5J4WC88_9EUKA|nr:MAG: hypothetical protein EZS28_012300 [Streblomastix strix]